MPYKDPEKRRQRVRQRRQELKENNPEKYENMLIYHREHLRKYRSQLTADEKAARLQKRRARYLEDNPGSEPRKRFADQSERLEDRRKYHRDYARKRYKQDPSGSYQSYKRYWQNTTKERRDRRREKQAMYSHNRRLIDPDYPNRNYRELKNNWTCGIDCRNPAIWKTAENKAMELAKRLGYTDIFQPDFKYFYFDFAARKEDKITVFQVTTLRWRQIKRKHLELVKYFGFDYVLIHVRPTLDEAFVTPIFVEIPETKVVNYLYSRGTPYPL